MRVIPDDPARPVPAIPEPADRIPLLIDTDAANEIDDLYAIALAMARPDRFDIRGFVATHFAAAAGRESIRLSYDVLKETIAAAGLSFAVALGGDPLPYRRTPVVSEGADLIIAAARACAPHERLLVLALGAASNVASALLLAPEIRDRVVVMFHGRSEETWPDRTRQFNIVGDLRAAQNLLECDAPLVWFDTGTRLTASMEETERRLAPCGAIGRFLHDYRFRRDGYQTTTKGFFDLGDIAWLIDPGLCSAQAIPAPTLTNDLRFDHERTHGRMLHVSEIDPGPTWELFFCDMARAFGGEQGSGPR